MRKRKDVTYVADLANLELTDQERQRMVRAPWQMQAQENKTPYPNMVRGSLTTEPANRPQCTLLNWVNRLVEKPLS